MSQNIPENGLIDNYGRKINYLRLSITDRCNLRCRYCMGEEGVSFLDHTTILTYEELERLVGITKKLGITKYRITGGEPFARKGCLEFLTRLKEVHDVEQLFITSNGVELMSHLGELKKIGISGINLSVDTVDSDRYEQITRRRKLDQVMAVFHETLRLGIPLKINSVVQEDTTDDELTAVASLIRENPISLRFIEIMPFTGVQQKNKKSSKQLEERLSRLFPGIYEISFNDVETARRFGVPGMEGTLGIIEGESRKFCSTCNKLRITSQGILKTCLYDQGALNLRQLMRDGATDEDIATQLIEKVNNRFKHGFEAEEHNKNNFEESMAKVGG